MKNKTTSLLFAILPFFLMSQNIQINRINIDPGANTYRLDDLNADGLPDIIATGMYWDVEIFLNKGNFKFQYIDVDGDPGRSETFSNQAGFVDFDKDGDKDLVHVNCPACGDNGVNLYMNDDFKSFTKKLTIAPNPGSDVIYDAFDINKDGYEDLIVSGTKTTYYINDAGKGFKAGVILTPNAVFDYLHHQDLNGDGFVDLVARSSKDVYTFINNAGTFGTGNKLTNYDLSGYVSAKDLNGDGILDYYTSFNYCLKAMLSNKSKSELFDPLTTILCANNSETKHDLVDVDGDGDLDIVHGKISGEGIYFKRKNANGYETSKLLNHAGFQHAFYITADFNKDGTMTF
ncbi:MAG: VCBS repeat-containing protein [Saprospiraceae bacterium]|nr:VCBS repeat-containing protein [Saprospiraceae bacterium]